MLQKFPEGLKVSHKLERGTGPWGLSKGRNRVVLGIFVMEINGPSLRSVAIRKKHLLVLTFTIQLKTQCPEKENVIGLAWVTCSFLNESSLRLEVWEGVPSLWLSLTFRPIPEGHGQKWYPMRKRICDTRKRGRDAGRASLLYPYYNIKYGTYFFAFSFECFYV